MDTPFKTYLDKILPDVSRRFYNFYLASIGSIQCKHLLSPIFAQFRQSLAQFDSGISSQEASTIPYEINVKLYIALSQVLFIAASWMDLDFPVLKPESYCFPAAVATIERFHINFNVSEVDLQVALNEVYFPGV